MSRRLFWTQESPATRRTVTQDPFSILNPQASRPFPSPRWEEVAASRQH